MAQPFKQGVDALAEERRVVAGVGVTAFLVAGEEVEIRVEKPASCSRRAKWASRDSRWLPTAVWAMTISPALSDAMGLERSSQTGPAGMLSSVWRSFM